MVLHIENVKNAFELDNIYVFHCMNMCELFYHKTRGYFAWFVVYELFELNVRWYGRIYWIGNTEYNWLHRNMNTAFDKRNCMLRMPLSHKFYWFIQRIREKSLQKIWKFNKTLPHTHNKNIMQSADAALTDRLGWQITKQEAETKTKTKCARAQRKNLVNKKVHEMERKQHYFTFLR